MKPGRLAHRLQNLLFALRRWLPAPARQALKPVYRRWWQWAATRGSFLPAVAADTGQIDWQCNICGYHNRSATAALTREAPPCVRCLSTVRHRAIVHLLSLTLFEKSLPLASFPERRDLRGIGLTDWEGYAALLARKLNYTNTYFHQAPQLDITDIASALDGMLDFLIATEVFEHVAPPIERAFVNARRLLKPGGVLIMSVPYGFGAETIEHFPELHDYALIGQGARRLLRNVTQDGRVQVFDQLVFHGGPGPSVEMRRFSEAGLRACLAAAGFGQVRFCGEAFSAYGVYWEPSWSPPLIARPG